MKSETSLGTIKKIDDLRSVWPHEAHDFSKWLAKEENLTLLSETIGIDIVLEELESAVGGFNVDLYATEEGTGRKIIIENQLEDTNHDHLGKIITYASGKGAEVIVWIVKRARDEHRLAVEWLNQHTDSNIGIFLLEIELWQINDSPYAPKFNIVERPNDWAKSVKAVEGVSDTKNCRWNSGRHLQIMRLQIQILHSNSKKEKRSLSIGMILPLADPYIVLDLRLTHKKSALVLKSTSMMTKRHSTDSKNRAMKLSSTSVQNWNGLMHQKPAEFLQLQPEISKVALTHGQHYLIGI